MRIFMSRKLEDLTAGVEKGIRQIKSMTDGLETSDLSRISGQLQRIIECAAEVAKLVDDLEVVQREVEIQKAVNWLIEAGYTFQTIEIDGMRFNITGDDELQFYSLDDDIRR